MARPKKNKQEIYQGYLEDALRLADTYPDLVKERDACKEELQNLPKFTWNDAFTMLSGGHQDDMERVQTSGTSDPTARIALNIDKVIERENRLIFEECWERYQKLSADVNSFEYGMKRLSGRTRFVAEQLFIQRKCWKEIVDESGDALGTSSVQFERNRAIEAIAGSLEEFSERELCMIFG